MSIDTEFFGRSRFKPVPKQASGPVKLSIKVKGVETKKSKKRRLRDIVFETILPGLFVVLIYYHFFIYSPDTPVFYSNLLARCLNAG
jgi:hypothetical protein